MLKAICKNAVWMAVPLSLALGCAANRPTTTSEAVYGPTPVLTPTSGEPEQRIYSADPNAAPTSVEAPPGAATADWSVAQAIREKLTQDPTLAPLGSSLIAEVGKDGTVTLKGVVKTDSEKERVRETISGVPGIKSINDDQVRIGSFKGSGKLDMTEP